MTGQPADPLKVERALADLSDTLEKLENMFLKRQPFLCGDDISLADLLAMCELMQVRSSGSTGPSELSHWVNQPPLLRKWSYNVVRNMSNHRLCLTTYNTF